MVLGPAGSRRAPEHAAAHSCRRTQGRARVTSHRVTSCHIVLCPCARQSSHAGRTPLAMGLGWQEQLEASPPVVGEHRVAGKCHPGPSSVQPRWSLPQFHILRFEEYFFSRTCSSPRCAQARAHLRCTDPWPRAPGGLQPTPRPLRSTTHTPQPSLKRPQFPTYVVVGVEDAGDVLGQVSVQHRLDVVPDVDCGGAEGQGGGDPAAPRPARPPLAPTYSPAG